MAKKNNRGPRGLQTTESLAPNKVKMRFSEHKYYTDLEKPIFMAGKVYELEGAEWIHRWLKRGGEIVAGEIPSTQPDEPNPSTIVGQSGEQTSDNTPPAGETKPETDSGKADGQEPDAGKNDETDPE